MCAVIAWSNPCSRHVAREGCCVSNIPQFTCHLSESSVWFFLCKQDIKPAPQFVLPLRIALGAYSFADQGSIGFKLHTCSTLGIEGYMMGPRVQRQRSTRLASVRDLNCAIAWNHSSCFDRFGSLLLPHLIEGTIGLTHQAVILVLLCHPMPGVYALHMQHNAL
eukprot:5766153-Amphidinium_carterae.1